jgi:hypothetical protein
MLAAKATEVVRVIAEKVQVTRTQADVPLAEMVMVILTKEVLAATLVGLVAMAVVGIMEAAPPFLEKDEQVHAT